MSCQSIFVSYAHEDVGFKDEICRKLKIWEIQKQLRIELWVDDNIAGGDDWRQEIDAAMERADLGVLLISDAFITSEFIMNEELRRLRERFDEGKLKLYPVVVRDCVWDALDFIKSLQVRPNWRAPLSLPLDEYEREQDWTTIAREIKEILDETGDTDEDQSGVSGDIQTVITGYDPNAYADLEIGLYHYAYHTYQVELRFNQSGPKLKDNRLERSCVRIDPVSLHGDAPDTLGSMLGKLLFGNAEMLEALTHAESMAKQLNSRLQLRICIGSNARELCRVPWELIRNPRSGKFLTQEQDVLVTRFLVSSGREGEQSLSHSDKVDLRAVASPARAFLPPRAVVSGNSSEDMEELEFATQRLAILGANVEAIEGVPLADWERMAELYGQCDVLYLAACNPDSSADPGPSFGDQDVCGVGCGKLLVKALGRLRNLPRLLVLAPPMRRGEHAPPEEVNYPALGETAVAVVEHGIIAVVTAQGPVSAKTWTLFLDSFFAELTEHGNLMVALAVAREAITGREDWWAPILVPRSKGGFLWYRSGFEDSREGERTWDNLIGSIKKENCVPILGPGLAKPYVGSRQYIARILADKYYYPMAFHDRSNLRQVTQYLHVDFKNRGTMIDNLQKVFAEHLEKTHTKIFSGKAKDRPLDDIVQDIGRSVMQHNELDAYRQLSNILFPLYLTTNQNGLMAMALREYGDRQPTEMVYAHNATGRIQKCHPEAAKPLVYHLFGRLNDPDNIVLTEDDYFDFLLNIASERNVIRSKRRIPENVFGAMTNSSLLFIGFKVHQWEFRVLFRALMSIEGSANQKSKTHVAVQIDPDDEHTMDPRGAKRYLERLFSSPGRPEINIYWGSPQDFVSELHSRLPNDFKHGVSATGGATAS